MLNPYFQQGAKTEQNLIQDLINEQLKMYGVEVHYLPRKYMTEASIMKEVIRSQFDDAYPIEAYVENYDGYGQNPILLSKFGIQATNELTLIISRERFEDYISPLMKRQWGQNLLKFPGVKLPGGVELNGGQIYDDAEKDLEIIREQMSNMYELPPLDMIG